MNIKLVKYFVVALVTFGGVAVHEGDFTPDIPKTWDDRIMASLEIRWLTRVRQLYTFQPIITTAFLYGLFTRAIRSMQWYETTGIRSLAQRAGAGDGL